RRGPRCSSRLTHRPARGFGPDHRIDRDPDIFHVAGEASTDLPSLNENEDRLAIIVDMVVAAAGSISATGIYRARVHNRAPLTNNGVGPWLEGKGSAPAKVAASAGLASQLKLQDETAQALRQARDRMGALNFDRVEPEAIVTDGKVQGIVTRQKNRAGKLIEDFMIAANEVIARTL